MVEVLEQSKIESGFDSLIGFSHSEHRSEFDGELLVSYGSFQHRFVLWLDARADFLLRLFALSHESEFSSQIVVVAVTEELMGEPHRLVFRAVRENTAQFRKRTHVVFGITLRIHGFPIAKQLIEVFGLLFKRIE